jgi:hypothetical protein
MFNKNKWYEVFKSNKVEGTQTLFSCSRLKNAREFKRKHDKIANQMGETLHIDKWAIIRGFPQPIKEVN